MSEGCLGVQVVFGWCVVVFVAHLECVRVCHAVSGGVWKVSGGCIGVLGGLSRGLGDV